MSSACRIACFIFSFFSLYSRRIFSCTLFKFYLQYFSLLTEIVLSYREHDQDADKQLENLLICHQAPDTAAAAAVHSMKDDSKDTEPISLDTKKETILRVLI